jgi:hypothetical protein
LYEAHCTGEAVRQTLVAPMRRREEEEEESEIAARFNVHVDLVERLSRIWVSARAAKPSDSLNPPSTSFPRFVEFTISLVLTCFQCAGDADTAACSLFVQRDTTNIETALSLAETAS